MCNSYTVHGLIKVYLQEVYSKDNVNGPHDLRNGDG